MADEKPHLHVEFYSEPQEDPAESRKAGRPIFKDVEMVKIQIAGDPKNNLIAPAHSASHRDRETGLPLTYAMRFPDHYRFFKDNLDQQAAGGTPISEAPWLAASKREELKALKVYTLEALAQLDGTLLQRLGMGARELKNKAQAWLDAAAGNAAEGRLASLLAARDDEIEALKRQMADFIASQSGKAPAVTQEPVSEEPDPTASPFNAWADEDIKNWIKDATGSRPAGNPSHKTLVARADEINAEIAEKKAA